MQLARLPAPIPVLDPGPYRQPAVPKLLRYQDRGGGVGYTGFEAHVDCLVISEPISPPIRITALVIYIQSSRTIIAPTTP